MKLAKIVVKALLMFLLVSAIFTGCTGGNDYAANNTNQTVLTVEVFERGNAPANGETPDNNRWTDWINEKFGKPNNIVVKFHPIQRMQEIEKLNVLMAAAQAPDIIFTYDRTVFNNFVQQNALMELDGLIEKYGSNLTKVLGDTLEYHKIDGKQYGISAKRAFLGQFTSYVRKDWLDALNLEPPTTTQEWYHMIKAFKEEDPGKVGKENVVAYPLTAYSLSREDWQQNTLHLVYSFVEDMSKKDFYTLPQVKYPGYKEGVRFLNKLFNEGFIDPDFALQNDYKKFNEHISTGRAGFFLCGTNAGFSENGVLGALYKNNPNAEIIPIDPFRNKNGNAPKRMYSPAAINIMIPKFSKSAEAAIKYLDWMADEKYGFELLHGVEGEHYKLEDGIPIVIDSEHNKLTKWNNTDLAIIYNGTDFGDAENYYKSLRVQSGTYGDLKEKGARTAVVDGYFDPFYSVILQAENKYRSILDKKYQEIMIKSIMVPAAQFDDVYDKLVDEYMHIGGQELMNEKLSALDSGKYFEPKGENIYKLYVD